MHTLYFSSQPLNSLILAVEKSNSHQTSNALPCNQSASFMLKHTWLLCLVDISSRVERTFYSHQPHKNLVFLIKYLFIQNTHLKTLFPAPISKCKLKIKNKNKLLLKSIKMSWALGRKLSKLLSALTLSITWQSWLWD